GLNGHANLDAPAPGRAVGARIARLDGIPNIDGTELYDHDAAPEDALWLRAVRSPHWSATFTIGDLAPLHKKWSGLVEVLTAKDVTGKHGFGIYPHVKDQPVLAPGEVRFRGEAVCALVGDYASVY